MFSPVILQKDMFQIKSQKIMFSLGILQKDMFPLGNQIEKNNLSLLTLFSKISCGQVKKYYVSS